MAFMFYHVPIKQWGKLNLSFIYWLMKSAMLINEEYFMKTESNVNII